MNKLTQQQDEFVNFCTYVEPVYARIEKLMDLKERTSIGLEADWKRWRGCWNEYYPQYAIKMGWDPHGVSSSTFLEQLFWSTRMHYDLMQEEQRIKEIEQLTLLENNKWVKHLCVVK